MAMRALWFMILLASIAQPDDLVRSRARELRAALTQHRSSVLRECVARSYFTSVPEADLWRWVADVERAYGAIRSMHMLRLESATRGWYEVMLAKPYAFRLTIEVDQNPPNRILYIWNSGVHPYFTSPKGIRARAKALGKRSSFLIAEIREAGIRPIVAVREKEVLSVASLMKLYVLAAVTTEIRNGRHSWREVVELDHRMRSLSMGVIHDWPEGTPMTLQTLASLMIARSDNTATDVLLTSLGRDRFEAMLGALGHSDPTRTSPFLLSSELLTLKYYRGGALGREYARLDDAKKRRFIAERVAPIDVDSVHMPATATPTLVSEVGWFASARDLAEVIYRIWRLGNGRLDSIPLQILGTGRDDGLPGSVFEFCAAKGGSDNGVRGFAYLVRKDGRWYVVIAIWNDDIVQPREDDLLALVRGSLIAIARKTLR